MKGNYPIVFALICSFLVVPKISIGQIPDSVYFDWIRKGDEVMKNSELGNENELEKALKYYLSALIGDPSEAQEVSEKIQAVFDAIQAQKIREYGLRKEAARLLHISEKTTTELEEKEKELEDKVDGLNKANDSLDIILNEKRELLDNLTTEKTKKDKALNISMLRQREALARQYILNVDNLDEQGANRESMNKIALLAFLNSYEFLLKDTLDLRAGIYQSLSTASGDYELVNEEGHFDKIRGLIFYSKEDVLLTAGDDGYVNFWKKVENGIDSKKYRIISFLEQNIEPAFISSIYVDPVNEILLTGDERGFVKIYNLPDLFKEFTNRSERLEKRMNRCQKKRNTRWLNIFDRENTMVRRIGKIRKKSEKAKKLTSRPHITQVFYDSGVIRFLGDGNKLFATNTNGRILELFLEPRRKFLSNKLNPNKLKINFTSPLSEINLLNGKAVDFNSEKSLMAFQEAESFQFKIRNLTSKRNYSFPQDLVPGEIIYTIAFNEKGDLLAAGGKSGRLYLWKINGEEVQPIEIPAKDLLMKHGASIMELAFAGEYKYLISGGGDQKVRVWELNQNPDTLISKRPLEIETHSWVSHIALNSKGTQPRVAVTGTDAVIKIFSLSEEHIVEEICPELIAFLKNEYLLKKNSKEEKDIFDLLKTKNASEINCPFIDEYLK